jgi:hypothetical protein
VVIDRAQLRTYDRLVHKVLCVQILYSSFFSLYPISVYTKNPISLLILWPFSIFIPNFRAISFSISLSFIDWLDVYSECVCVMIGFCYG